MYDVIVVGGRVAGSTLATRLGQAGLRVLLLERAELPSLPAVSSPIIYAPAMSLLDEIGADEAAYARNTPRIQRWLIEAEGLWQAEQSVPLVQGRDYAYAIDRARFDGALWDVAQATPHVEARQNTSVIDLLWDDKRVVGVRAKDITTGDTYTEHAQFVVGADGRFSVVARKAGASERQRHDNLPTSNYYANWIGVEPVDDGPPAAHMISTGGDYGLLLMDSADDQTVIAIEGRTDKMRFPRGEAESFYEEMLLEHPSMQTRLQNAQRVTPISGMKQIGNLYRQAGGPGWALVGDAVHQKDPLDGQGIYDALFTAKMLSAQIVAHCQGKRDWPGAVHAYQQALAAETLPMYHSTLARVQREIYTHRPQWFMRTFARWLYTDEKYLTHWAKLFVRQIQPSDWFSYRIILLAVLRGMWRETQQLLSISQPT